MLDLNRLSDAVRYEGGVSRRLFLAYAAALAALPRLARPCAAGQGAAWTKDPFSLGVASGDPDDSSVVLWTRLAPEPLQADGGLDPLPINVRWKVAEDDRLTKIVAAGEAVASPLLGHSVHVEVTGLKSDRWYFFQFYAGDAESPVGRTRTLPSPDTLPERLRFAVASCQHYEQGLFTAYEQMAADDLDLVFHLGDYIYEYGGIEKRVRKHAGKECESLGEYRVRHAQYRSEPLLQTMHRRCPWFVTWDDHEFDNNCAGLIPEITKNAKGEIQVIDPAAFLARRAAAYQAYYEAMPLRAASLPKGPDMQLYRKASFGRLAEFFVLDTRQYRSDQPNNDVKSDLNDAARDPRNTLLGQTQRGWLFDSLGKSSAAWNVLAQQVMTGLVSFRIPPNPQVFSMDQWPGYAHERGELVKFLAERKIANPVMLAGDIHSNWANELRIDDRHGETPVVASEFVTTSISSGGNGSAKPKNLDEIVADNPFVKLHNTERGYLRCTLSPAEWRTDFVAVDDVLKPGGKSFTRATMVVEAGKAGIEHG